MFYWISGGFTTNYWREDHAGPLPRCRSSDTCGDLLVFVQRAHPDRFSTRYGSLPFCLNGQFKNIFIWGPYFNLVPRVLPKLNLYLHFFQFYEEFITILTFYKFYTYFSFLVESRIINDKAIGRTREPRFNGRRWFVSSRIVFLFIYLCFIIKPNCLTECVQVSALVLLLLLSFHLNRLRDSGLKSAL